MKKQELDQLLEKYYKGESTEEEESILLSFFSSNDVPDGYETEKAMFSFYRSNAEIPEPSEGFADRIIRSIDQAEERKFSGRPSGILLSLISVAAGIIIIAGTWFFFIHQKNIEDTFTDPYVAYNETLKILYNVSNQLNQAEKVLEPVSEMTNLPAKSLQPLNKSRIILGKSLENLSSLHNEIDNMSHPDTNKNNNE